MTSNNSGLNGHEKSVHPFLATLDTRISMTLKNAEETELYATLFDTNTDVVLLKFILRNILLEVFSYGPHVTEATFSAIGRFPKKDAHIMKPLIKHVLSEVGHGELALEDYIRLGGDENFARRRRISPCSFAVGSVCRMLAQFESPFAYLGYMYLFEALTPILTNRVQVYLQNRGFPSSALSFVQVHSTEDIAHTALLRQVIQSIVDQFNEAGHAIIYGYDCFSVVYPFHVWSEVLASARREYSLQIPA